MRPRGVGNAAIREHAQTIERDAGASAVTNEPLAALIVVGFDPDRRVEIEAVEVRDEAAAAALGFEPAVAVLLRSGAPRIESLECAAADGELSASIHRAELGGLVRSLLGRTLVEEPHLSEPPEHAVTHAAHDPIERLA